MWDSLRRVVWTFILIFVGVLILAVVLFLARDVLFGLGAAAVVLTMGAGVIVVLGCISLLIYMWLAVDMDLRTSACKSLRRDNPTTWAEFYDTTEARWKKTGSYKEMSADDFQDAARRESKRFFVACPGVDEAFDEFDDLATTATRNTTNASEAVAAFVDDTNDVPWVTEHPSEAFTLATSLCAFAGQGPEYADKWFSTKWLSLGESDRTEITRDGFDTLASAAYDHWCPALKVDQPSVLRAAKEARSE